jgi:hypothetical protein
VIDLPKELAHHCLTNWLTIKDVGELDSAYYNRVRRTYLLKEIFDNEATILKK